MLKSLLGYILIGLIKLVGLTPLKTAQKLGRGIGWLLWSFRSRAREVARVNLGLGYPDMAPEQCDRLLRDALLHSGMTAAEMGPFWGYSQQEGLKLLNKVHGGELLDRALADERGVLLLIPHQGNWELTNNFISGQSPVTFMYRPLKNQVFNDWMVKRREMLGCNLVPTTGAGVRRLFEVLQSGGVVGFLPDQEPKRRSGVFVPFMSVPALTPKLPGELLRKTGAIALMVCVVRLPDAQGFDIHISEPPSDIYADDPKVSAAAMNLAIERCIALCPEQYQWEYKRFKHRPEHALSPYAKAGVP